MTKEELKQEAEEYRENRADCQYFSEPYKRKIEKAYVAGAEPREQRIKELEVQIEKMKNCHNCFYDCDDCNSKNKNCDKCPCGTCIKLSNWEPRK